MTPRRPGHRRLGSGRTGPGATRSARRVGGGRADAAVAPRHRLTGRAAILVLVVATLVVSYASSLRAYVEQRHHLDTLESSIASSQEQIAQLRREKRRWSDDAYVVSQARARFAYGFPGEVGFRVLDEQGQPLESDDSLSDPDPVDLDPEWWETTVESIQTAGRHAEEPPGPAEKIGPPPRARSDR